MNRKVLLSVIVLVLWPSAWADQKPEVTISKETTGLTSPLRRDGYVDYARALEERAFRGVTPENNAAIDLVRAAGAKGFSKRPRISIEKALGIDFSKLEGPFLVSLEDFAEQRGETIDEDADEDFCDRLDADEFLFSRVIERDRSRIVGHLLLTRATLHAG